MHDKSDDQHARLPRVSVVVPIRNEARFIERGLRAILEQDYPPGCMEVIVADGMSTDGTREVIQLLERTYQNLRMIDNPGRIVSTGLNAAFAVATGEVFVRVDGHCQIPEDYIRRCVELLIKSGADGVGGTVRTIGVSPISRAIAATMSSPFGVGDSAFRLRRSCREYADTIPFPVYWKRAMERAGPFDEELVRDQDDEYNYRLRRLGGKLLLAGEIESTYYSRVTLRSFWKQYFQYGYWKVRVLQKHPFQMRLRQFVPPLFVLSLIVSLLLSPVSGYGMRGFLVLGLLYVVANLVASATVSSRAGSCPLLLLPVCFAVLHTAYGAGFLAGLLRFASRWGDRGVNGVRAAM